MNKLQYETRFIGNLGEDATVTQLENRQVVNFSVCVTKVWYNKQQEKQTKSIWWKVKRFFPKGKNVDLQHLKKGAGVMVSGESECEAWVKLDAKKKVVLDDQKRPIVETQLVLNCDDWFITRFVNNDSSN